MNLFFLFNLGASRNWFRIVAEYNVRIVNYLDVTLTFNSSSLYSYYKPDDFTDFTFYEQKLSLIFFTFTDLRRYTVLGFIALDILKFLCYY